MKWQDMIEKTFGPLTVIRRLSKEEIEAQGLATYSVSLLCKCTKCGAELGMRRDAVERCVCPNCKKLAGKSGRGRAQPPLQPGDRFGKLTVIEYVEPHVAPSGVTIARVKCKCDCGKEIIVRKAHLVGYKRGANRPGYKYTVSCGCSQVSAGEMHVRRMLEKLGVAFKEQYIIPELSTSMRFDFAVFNKNQELAYLIEYDGEQHFQSIELWGGEQAFITQQERDQRKNIYCKEKGIPLIRIPYTEKLYGLTPFDILPSSRFQI